MRRLLILLATSAMTAHCAHAQAIVLPANSDLRAMQAPADWEGSRSQRAQDADPEAARWSASAVAPTVVPPAAAPSRAASPALEPDAPDFRVEVWDRDDRLVETMAHCSSLSIGRAAFKEAAKERPKQKVTLRRDAIVVASREAPVRSR